MQYGVLLCYLFAMAMCVWSAVQGVQLAIDSSVPGGLAVLLAAAVLFAVTAWRVNVKWKQLHSEDARESTR